MAKNKVDWKYNGIIINSIDQIPEKIVGFIYVVRNLTTDKVYYGKKSLYSHRKKRLTPKEKLLPENKRKTFKIETTHTAWQNYTGSCKILNDDLVRGDVYEKEILKFCTSRVQMTVLEMKIIFCENCLEGEHCYNENIGGKYFPKNFLD